MKTSNQVQRRSNGPSEAVLQAARGARERVGKLPYGSPERERLYRAGLAKIRSGRSGQR